MTSHITSPVSLSGVSCNPTALLCYSESQLHVTSQRPGTVTTPCSYGTITPYFHITKQACHTLKSSLILVTTKTCHIVRCTVTLSNDHCNRLTQMILKLHMTTNIKLGGTKDTVVSYCHIVYNETTSVTNYNAMSDRGNNQIRLA